MFRIKNTTDDRTKHILHRTASKFETEPTLGGSRIRLGSHLDITDEHYARVKPLVDEWVGKGMVSVTRLGSDDGSPVKEKDGPTLEEWVKAGYEPKNYASTPVGELHSWGFRIKPSAGLMKYLKEQETAAEEAKLIAELEKLEAADAAAKAEAQAVQRALAEEAAKVVMEAQELPSVTEQILPATPVTPPTAEEKSDKKSSSGKGKLR